MVRPLPRWMRLLGAGLTGCLAVLFVVVLLQTREQAQRLQQVQEKVQTLENANDLERTNALEDQLRSAVERLQALEGVEQQVQTLRSEVQSLRQLRSRSSSFFPVEPDFEPTPPPPVRVPGNR
jgi:TolA-binding protein